MGQLAGLLNVGGNVMGGIGQQQSAVAEKKAAKFNAKLAKREGFREEGRIRAAGRREASFNVTRVAKSGVRLEGSPLEVLAENAAIVEFEALWARQAGLVASQMFRQRAKAAQQGESMALFGGLLGGGAAAGQSFGGSGSGFGGGPAPANRQTTRRIGGKAAP